MNFNFLIANIPLRATTLGGEGSYAHWLTNSVFVAALMVALVIFCARKATVHMQLVPGGAQNLFETLVEGLYNLLESIVGKHMIKRTFSFLAALFIYILFSNWFSLLPGVGTIGWGVKNGTLSLSEVTDPLLRPASADLNMTLGLAIVSMILWFYWTIREVGLVGFLKHIFAPKGGMTGFAGFMMAIIFIFVGLLEIISISTRPVSLSLRLFGNIYAGENILSTMITLGHDFHWPDWLAMIGAITIPIPFYILELMVGLLQAFVFMLLVAVYIQLSTSHDEESH